MLPIEKLEAVHRRNQEIEQLLCEPATSADPSRLYTLNRERSQIQPVVAAFGEWRALEKRIREDQEALDDPELGPMVREELPELEAARATLEQQIRILLLPQDPNDDKNTILEIRGGTGGEEAALFAADLLRMYSRYAETKGWRIELLSQSEASGVGSKRSSFWSRAAACIRTSSTKAACTALQRVPTTEAQGRIHTSTATVAVLPEADDVDVTIDDKDLRFDIAASGGPGGQGVNTTNSAVQITHLPTGLMVKCQDERSQIKNKSKALKILRSRLLDIEQQKQADALRDERRGMVKAGIATEKIRTYNFPQNRLTDHRIGLTLYQLDRVMTGDVAELTDALVAWYQAAELERQATA